VRGDQRVRSLGDGVGGGLGRVWVRIEFVLGVWGVDGGVEKGRGGK